MNDEQEFAAGDFEAAAVVVGRFRTRALLCSPLGDGAAPLAEQHYLLALAALEQAQRHLRIADLCQAEAIGRRQLGGS